MPARHVVVVGGSLAGLRTVEALRRLGDDSRITLVSDEATLPYDRPPLSKQVLLGKADEQAVALTTTGDLAGLDVDVLVSTRASALDVGRRTVRLDGDGRGELAFDDLVVATGAAATVPAGFPTGPGIHTLRTLDDALSLRAGLERASSVAVLGGGFIGSEVASACRTLGLEVTVVDLAPVLMQRGLGTVVGERMTRIARDAGVRLRLGSTVADVVTSGEGVEGVRLDNGTVVAADLLVVGIGARPATGWLTDSGLTLDDGVACDPLLRAAPHVYAVGDVARWHHPHYDRAVRFEHWTTAGEHADAVAATLTGTPTASDEIPYVWSDQFDHKIQVAGLLDPSDEVAFLVDEPERFVAIAGSAGEQHAAFALNAPGALVRQRMKLAGRPPWPQEMG